MKTKVRTRQERTRRQIYLAFVVVMLAAFASFLTAVGLSSAYPPPHVPFGVKGAAVHTKNHEPHEANSSVP